MIVESRTTRSKNNGFPTTVRTSSNEPDLRGRTTMLVQHERSRHHPPRVLSRRLGRTGLT